MSRVIWIIVFKDILCYYYIWYIARQKPGVFVKMEVLMRIGIDIGGMSIKIGLVNEDYKITSRKVIKTGSSLYTPREIIKNIVEAARGLIEENNAKLEEISAGIACPGTSDSISGVVLYSNNIGWENVPFVKIFNEYLDIPCAIANDADAAALAEVLCGAARGRENVVLLTLGTGVGSGVVINKKIFTGYMRGGCELGHIVIKHGGLPCTCGRKGCFESYASASALMASAREAAEKNKKSLLNVLCGGNISNINGEMVFEAERAGDKAAIEVVEMYIEYLSTGIANIINIFRPEIVILGGGVSAQKQYLTDRLSLKVKNMCFGGTMCGTASIVTSCLGNDAGIIGAAYLP